MKEINVKIDGVTALLFNRFMSGQIDSETKKRPGANKELDIKDKLYKDGMGNVCVPSTWVIGSIIDASKNFKIVGKGKSTYSKLVGSSVNVNPELLIVTPQKWEAYSISAVNPMTRGRMMVSRPRMDKWSTTFRLSFNENDIPLEVMKEIVDYAGQYSGIGDWRPNKKGQFGKFIVTRFE